MEKTRKMLIATTLFLIPAYLIKFTVLSIPTNVLEILVLATFLFSLSGEKFDWKNFYKENKIYIFCIALIFAGLLISTLVNEDYRIGFGIIKGWFVVPLAFSWLLIKELKSKENLENVLKWLYLGIFGVAAVALIYYFQGILTYDGRLRAFYLSPNHLAMYLAPAIFINLQLITHDLQQKNKIKSIFFISSLIVISVALYLTYSYAAWLAIIAGITISSLVRKKVINRKIILVGIVALIIIIASQLNSAKFENLKFFSRSSLESRIIIWKSAVKILEDNPLWGIGPGNFQSKYLEYQKYFSPYLEWAVPQPHNLYLAFWLQAGISGIAGFLVLIAKWLRDVIRIIKNNNGSLLISSVLAGVMFYILIHGLVDTTYWKNDLSIIFWTIFSLGLIIRDTDLSYESSHPKG